MRTHLGTACLVLSMAWAGCNGGGGGSSALGAPAGVTAKEGAQKVELTWQAVNGATSYDVYWATATGVTAATGTKISGLTATSYAHTGLLPGTYFYVVAAVGADGEGALSAEVSAPVHPVAFASSTTDGGHGGNLGAWDGAGGKTGLEAGDAICQSLATAAGLAGTFRAWLSDGTSDAYCRIHGLTGKKSANCGQATLPATAGPWVRADGAPWAGRIDTITRSTQVEDVRVPLVVDEHGTAIDLTARYLATGTAIEGTAGNHCQGWTVANATSMVMGKATGIGAAWSGSSGTLCSASGLRLACMQTGAGPDLPAPVSAGARKAFVTSATGSGYLHSWAAAGSSVGIEAGHAVCRTLAAAAGLPNPTSYKAWLGVKDPGLTTGPSPADALGSDGPWERVDGVLVARTKADLEGPALLTGLVVDETGARADAAVTQAWTGDHRDQDTSVQTTCANWTSSMATDQGWAGWILDAGDERSHFTAGNCDVLRHLYCFED